MWSLVLCLQWPHGRKNFRFRADTTCCTDVVLCGQSKCATSYQTGPCNPWHAPRSIELKPPHQMACFDWPQWYLLGTEKFSSWRNLPNTMENQNILAVWGVSNVFKALIFYSCSCFGECLVLGVFPLFFSPPKLSFFWSMLYWFVHLKGVPNPQKKSRRWFGDVVCSTDTDTDLDTAISIYTFFFYA